MSADTINDPDSAPGTVPSGEARRPQPGTPEIPRELPILPVREVVVFPGTVVPLAVSREKSKRLIDAVLAGDKLIAVCTQRKADAEDPTLDDIYRIGTAATVLKLLRMPDGSQSLLVHGLARVGIEEMTQNEPFWRAAVNVHVDEPLDELQINALAHTARQTALDVIELSPNVPDEARMILENIDQPGPLADYLAANLSLGVPLKQELLETFDIADRLKKVTATLNNQLEVLQLSQKIQDDVRSQIDKTQREYYLQQQLKAIQKELGEGDTRAAEVDELRTRIADAKMPDAVLKEANRELTRMERIPQASPESGVIRDYLEWLIQMPWASETDDNLDLLRAEEVLNADHYGLDKIKRRILEYLAVRKLKPTGKSPILCFLGPPGVGKTSLGQSIARALGRTFIRISLGGVRDEADIRGHRRTYIGAIPGRIVQELRRGGTRNPVIMLDELDKLGNDFRGDPAAALLEVLDPAQNHSFTDHYLGVPFDLSRIMFIGTANTMETVPPPLRDRMELIELTGYTTGEKLEIAKRYLVPRQRDDNGIKDTAFSIPDETLRAIIETYTREAGVRELERMIGGVCRGVASRVARGEQPPAAVLPGELEPYLGPSRYEPEHALLIRTPGVATGLAYTPVGGEIIFIEAVLMPGRGGFMLTGQIGDVMRESAQAALTIVRARAKSWRLPTERFSDSDVHIHIPAGGVPKDGPSAGVAMLTALVSLLSRKPADPLVAMTGEITLRGQVLPIGGVKAKVLAAHRAGIRTVILPRRNQPDLKDVPADVRAELKFVLVDTVDDVLGNAIHGFVGAPAPSSTELTGRVSSRQRARPDRSPRRPESEATPGQRSRAAAARRRVRK